MAGRAVALVPWSMCSCAAGFPTLESSEIQHVEWEKLLQISIVAGWSASIFGAIGGSVAQGLLVKEAAEHYVQLAQELLGVYQAMGYEPADYYAPFLSIPGTPFMDVRTGGGGDDDAGNRHDLPRVIR